MITASSWMFISSFEEFRKKLLSSGSILTMVQQSTHGYAGVTVPTCIFVYRPGVVNCVGSYIRLEDFDRPQLQKPKTQEAIANPDCGWFYRRDASAFSAIPGSPIAYWASDAMRRAFDQFPSIGSEAKVLQGLATGNNDLFLRYWWEPARQREHLFGDGLAKSKGPKWFPCDKGGERRKWFGNLDWVINWSNDGQAIRDYAGSVIRNPDYYLLEGLTWGMISSGSISMRFVPSGSVFTNAGLRIVLPERNNSLDINYVLAALNSSVIEEALSFIAPTLNYSNGDVSKLPVPASERQRDVVPIVKQLISVSSNDNDSFETSWDFKRHPMV